MKPPFFVAIFSLAGALLLAAPAGAQQRSSEPADAPAAQGTQAPPPGIFEPPPVPRFMLQPPDTPLSREEMIRQADEAAARVRKQPERPLTSGEGPGSDEAPQGSVK